MKTYNVRSNGKVLKSFESKDEAKKWMFQFLMVQQLQADQLDYINEAVDKSDLKEAKEVLSYIMEK